MVQMEKVILGTLTSILVIVITIAIVWAVVEKKEKEKPDPDDPGKNSQVSARGSWLNGDYKVVNDITQAIFGTAHIGDNAQTFLQFNLLNPGTVDVHPMSWVRGEEDNTVIITLSNNTTTAVISEDKKTINGGLGLLANLDLVWMSPQDAQTINGTYIQSKRKNIQPKLEIISKT